MYCKRCYTVNSDNANKCVKCGADLNAQRQMAKKLAYYKGASKTLMGALCGFFLGIIGLIIGLWSYGPNTYERKTFLKGWVISLAISVVGVIFLYVFLLLIMGGGLLL
ncbi:MAG: hypothetical protein J6V66_07515 [Clostridia bacterium]|nr:hypothetical protein [Clostridia bacterium]